MSEELTTRTGRRYIRTHFSESKGAYLTYGSIICWLALTAFIAWQVHERMVAQACSNYASRGTGQLCLDLHNWASFDGSVGWMLSLNIGAAAACIIMMFVFTILVTCCKAWFKRHELHHEAEGLWVFFRLFAGCMIVLFILMDMGYHLF